jgi:hypothetical protein
MLSAKERRVRSAAVGALIDAVDVVNDRGYVSKWRENLLPGLTPANVATIKNEFGKGSGGEISGLRPKFCALHSSAALAANTFARWRNDPFDLALLEVGGMARFGTLELERPCRSGLRGTPPHLDALAIGRNGVVAIESKCTEMLSEHRASFRSVYAERFRQLAHPTWQRRFAQLNETPDRYRFLDGAQLLKHYLGLKNTFPQTSRVVLMYIWWEPRNADSLPIFAEHRREVASFADSLADPQIAFRWQSYPELWAKWSEQKNPGWLTGHVESLRRRYLVPVTA